MTTCCYLAFGTRKATSPCVLSTPITQNADAYPFFPYATPPTPDSFRIFYARAYSQYAYTDVWVRFWVWPPLVNGQFQGPEPSSKLVKLPMTNWMLDVSGVKLVKTFSFIHKTTYDQSVNGCCFVLRYENPDIGGCTSTCSWSDVPLDPLSAVWDRPW